MAQQAHPAHPEHHDVVGHASADDEYLVTPPGAGYEHTDASVWIIVKFGLWLAISAIIIHIGMIFVFALFVEQREEAEPTFPLAVGQERRLPTGARLQPIPVNDMYQFRQQEDQVLGGYRWVDRDAGRVQIPIAEAMRLTVERGLPARAAQPGTPAAETQGAVTPPVQGGPAAAPAQGEPAGAQGQPLEPQPGDVQRLAAPDLMPADSSAGRTMERRRQ